MAGLERHASDEKGAAGMPRACPRHTDHARACRTPLLTPQRPPFRPCSASSRPRPTTGCPCRATPRKVLRHLCWQCCRGPCEGLVGPLAALGAGAPLMAGPNSAGLASAGTTPGAGSTGTRQRGLPCRHPGHRVWPGTRPHLRLAGSVATSVQHFAHACMRAM